MDEIQQALNSLNDALGEDYPGESLNPQALRVALLELGRLQAVEENARIARQVMENELMPRIQKLQAIQGRAQDTAMDRGDWGDAARYILTGKS